MKLLISLLLCVASCLAGEPVKTVRYSAVTSAQVLAPVVDNQSAAVYIHTVQYISTTATCSFNLEDSNDSVTWTNNGTFNCGSVLQDIVTGTNNHYRRYVRINVTSLSGGSFTATYLGYVREFVSIVSRSGLSTGFKRFADASVFGNALTGTGKQSYPNTTWTVGTTSLPINTLYDVFTSSDVGDNILVSGVCGVDVCDQRTTITSVTDSTDAVLAASALNTLTVREVYWWNPSQNDTAFIQAALNASTLVYMPHGVYIRSAKFTYNNNKLRDWEGDGIESTVVLTDLSTDTSSGLRFTDVNNFRLADMTWRGPGINSGGGGSLFFDRLNNSNIERLRIDNIEVRNNATNGILVNTPILSQFSNVKSLLNAGDGIQLIDPVSCSLTNVYAITNVEYGIYINAGAANQIAASAAEANGISYYILNSFGTVISGSDSESQVHRAPDAPTSFPAATVSTGGSIPVGGYFLKYTWLRQWIGNALSLESLASPESLSVSTTAGNQTISFTLPIAPTDAPNVKFANIYITPTGGASGTEGFEIQIALNAGATTTVTLSSFLTPGAAPPHISAIGHGIVIDGGSDNLVYGMSSNTVPDALATHITFTGSSLRPSVKAMRILQGSVTPNFDLVIAPGVTSASAYGIATGRISDSGTGTVISAVN